VGPMQKSAGLLPPPSSAGPIAPTGRLLAQAAVLDGLFSGLTWPTAEAPPDGQRVRLLWGAAAVPVPAMATRGAVMLTFLRARGRVTGLPRGRLRQVRRIQALT